MDCIGLTVPSPERGLSLNPALAVQSVRFGGPMDQEADLGS